MIKNILKIIVLFVSWIVFPPVFYLLARWWYFSRLVMRRVLFFISPLVVFAIFYLIFYTSVLINDAQMGSESSIEEKTQMSFPSYSKNHFEFLSNLLQNNSFSSFHTDHSLSFTAKLEPSQCDDFFKGIDQLINDTAYNNPKEIEILERSWTKNSYGNYSFSCIREQPEETLNITINPKTYEMWVGFGTW